MPLTPDQVDDIVTTTISNFKRMKYTDISLEYQHYCSQEVLDDKRVVEQGGPDIRFDVKHSNTGTYEHLGLFSTVNTNVEDVMTQGTLPWRKQGVHYSYDVDEAAFQSSREMIVNLLAVREHNALNDWVVGCEIDMWSQPASTSDLRPMGIPFWIKKDATTTPGGAFNGGNPTNFTAGAAGISSTTYPAWRNWTFGYTNPTTDDLVAKIKKSLYHTNFVAPNPSPQLGYGKADYQIYTTYGVVDALERLAETRNDNLGSDVAKYIGMVTVGRVPMKAVPYLTANDSTAPLYGVNWRALRPYVLTGKFMRRTGPVQAPKQPTVRNVFLDTWMNWACVDRRALWVGSTS
jgi:hypothetical protein